MSFKPTLEWQEQCLEDLRADELSLTQLAKKYRRSPTTIRKLQRLAGVTRRPKAPKPCVENSPISRDHRRVGVRMTLLRGDRSSPEIANLLGVSLMRLKKMEVGQHDFTLSELIHISEELGEPLADLLFESPTLKVV